MLIVNATYPDSFCLHAIAVYVVKCNICITGPKRRTRGEKPLRYRDGAEPEKSEDGGPRVIRQHSKSKREKKTAALRVSITILRASCTWVEHNCVYLT